MVIGHWLLNEVYFIEHFMTIEWPHWMVSLRLL